MPPEFPFVGVPKGASKYLGEKDPKTRIYRREGSDDETEEWFDKVMEIAGHVISPGGVCIYARVSRAAVYKAINEGRLTAFGFRVIKEGRSVFGFTKNVREVPYFYVPVSEAKAWGEIIKAKVQGKTLTAEEDPGWVSDRAYEKLEGKLRGGRYVKKGEQK